MGLATQINGVTAGTPVARRPRGKPFPKGISGNPGGRPKQTEEEFMLVEACRKRTPEALAVVESLMRNSSNDRVRLAAAQFIIERGWGKAPERYEITGELNKSVVVGMLGVDLTPEQAYIVIPSIQRI